MTTLKKIFVTGGNSGIGFALCKQLALEENCHVFLGSRNEERGREAVSKILEGAPDGTKVELVVIDVSNDESVQAAAAALREHQPFYAIVNNAGIGIGNAPEVIIDINVMGPKRVVDAFLPLVDPRGGRIVATSSGAASNYVHGEGWGKKFGGLSEAQRKVLTSSDVTWEQITQTIDAERATNFGVADDTKDSHHPADLVAYGLSKAALTAHHMLVAVENPNLVVSSCTPGFIATKLTANLGATLTPEEGTVSLRKCLFGDLGECKGWYYGSDGLRSPLDVSRNPGEPEYQG